MSQPTAIQHSIFRRILLSVTTSVIIGFSVVMVVVTLAQVIFRYVISAPLPWSEELARYCFVWIVFLGGAIGLDRGIHLGVDILVNMFPDRFRTGFELLSNLLIMCFAATVVYASFPVISMNMMQRSPALGVQMTWVYIAIPISMCLIILICTERIFTIVRSGGREQDRTG